MPPAVALLNYKSSNILWRIFSQTFRGVFSLHLSLISPFIYVPLPSVCLDFGDFSSNSDLYTITCIIMTCNYYVLLHIVLH